MKTIDAAGWTRDFVEQPEPTETRQEFPVVYSLNGAIDVVRRAVLLATGGWFPARTATYIMPLERSVDVDTALDLALARVLLETPTEWSRFVPDAPSGCEVEPMGWRSARAWWRVASFVQDPWSPRKTT